jgi:hypothetical protein
MNKTRIDELVKMAHENSKSVGELKGKIQAMETEIKWLSGVVEQLSENSPPIGKTIEENIEKKIGEVKNVSGGEDSSTPLDKIPPKSTSFPKICMDFPSLPIIPPCSTAAEAIHTHNLPPHPLMRRPISPNPK